MATSPLAGKETYLPEVAKAAARAVDNAAPAWLVRGFVGYNVADLAAFTVADTRSGLTYVQGERVILCQQTTGSQNGIYEVGAVSAGVAALTRVAGMRVGDQLLSGTPIFIAEGGGGEGVRLYVANADPITIGTTSLRFTAWLNKGERKNLKARSVTTANVADLTAFTVANDGVTLAAGNQVLLVAQTDPKENGLYVVGTVNAGVAPLTRHALFQNGESCSFGDNVHVMQGTRGAQLEFFLNQGLSTVGTMNLTYMPRLQSGRAVLVAGVVTVNAYVTATSRVKAWRQVPGGTIASTAMYTAVDADFTIGAAGAIGSFVARAVQADGTGATSDTSTISWEVVDGTH